MILAAERLESAGIDLPTVTIEYNRLTYEADATVGSASMPTLLNTVKGALLVSTEKMFFCECVGADHKTL
jgi:hypothetical protein